MEIYLIPLQMLLMLEEYHFKDALIFFNFFFMSMNYFSFQNLPETIITDSLNSTQSVFHPNFLFVNFFGNFFSFY